ncbi:MAG TPA: YebC/PmpR family DNA-binding transcriptional regulator [Dehalococcoidia bacterium]|nr:YebC/PmpR family DNA-binding transcriptional regulator [Dehalococcoidia bacterium]
MSGHSKWSTIKRQKGAADAKRGALFTKLAREIQVAARAGGGDPDMNATLRLAVSKARDNNMPADNIERAIKKGTGDLEGAELQEMRYEGYGPGGAAILIDTLTDNKNRTVSEVRNIFTRAGGNMAEAGAVAWVFEPRGVITLEVDGAGADDLALFAIDAGAQDVELEDGGVDVITEPQSFEAVRKALEEAGYSVISGEVTMSPKTTVSLDEETAVKALRLLEQLEDHDDVQRVYSNADFPDSVLAAYAG